MQYHQIENDIVISNLEGAKKIAIPYGWNPIGETIHSVIYKLKAFNRLTARDTRELFQLTVSQKKKMIRSEWFRSDFDVDLIIERTGWPSTALEASFPDYLFCYNEKFRQHASERDNMTFSSDLKISQNLRICPSCYESGLHLIFHQSNHWYKCPIHNEDLKTKCTKCSSDTNQFVNTGSFEKNYKCYNCGYDPFMKESLPREYLRKIEVFDEYKNWCSLISETINRQSNTFLAISYTNLEEYLSDYVRLLNPPEWVANNTESDTRKLNHYIIPYSGKIKSTDGLVNIRDSVRSSCKGKVISTIADIETYFKKQLMQTRDLFRNTLLDEITYKLEDSYLSIVDRAFHYIDKDIDRILQSSFTDGSFWQAWHNGPGNRLGIRIRNSDIKTVNINFTKSASKIWFRLMLLMCFKRFLGGCNRDKDSISITHYLNAYAISVVDQKYVLTEIESERVTSVENSTEIRFYPHGNGSAGIDLADLLKEVVSARKTLKEFSKHTSYLQQAG